MTSNKQSQRAVMRRCSDIAIALFHDALAPPFTCQRAAAEPERYVTKPSNRMHRALSVAAFESQAFFDSPMLSIIGSPLTKSSSLRSVIAAEDRASGVTAGSHLRNCCSARGRDKVRRIIRSVLGARLRRYAPRPSVCARFVR